MQGVWTSKAVASRDAQHVVPAHAVSVPYFECDVVRLAEIKVVELGGLLPVRVEGLRHSCRPPGCRVTHAKNHVRIR
eukprot:6527095-Prymnesium_polylepis.2